MRLSWLFVIGILAPAAAQAPPPWVGAAPVGDCGSLSDAPSFPPAPANRIEVPQSCTAWLGPGPLDPSDNFVFFVNATSMLHVSIRLTSSPVTPMHGCFPGCSPAMTDHILKRRVASAGDVGFGVGSDSMQGGPYHMEIDVYPPPPQDDCGSGLDVGDDIPAYALLSGQICEGAIAELDPTDPFTLEVPAEADKMEVWLNGTSLVCAYHAGWVRGCGLAPTRLVFVDPTPGAWTFQTRNRDADFPGFAPRTSNYSLVATTATAPAQDDCGTGSDVATVDLTQPFACAGDIQGSFGDRSDAYRFWAEAGEVVDARLAEQVPGGGMCLQRPGQSVDWFCAGYPENDARVLRHFLDASGVWTVRLFTGPWWDTSYSLQVVSGLAEHVPQSDCGRGVDAGDSVQGALLVPDGECIGALPPASADQADVYAIDASPGDTVAYSVLSSWMGTDSCLYRPDGTLYRCLAFPNGPGEPEFQRVTVDEAGAWSIRVTSPHGLPEYRLNLSSAPNYSDCMSGRDAGGALSYAVPLPAIPIGCNATLVPADGDADDFYHTAPLRAGDVLRVDLQNGPLADADLCVFSPTSPDPVACSTLRDQILERVEFRITEDGAWRIGVHNVKGNNLYRLTVIVRQLG